MTQPTADVYVYTGLAAPIERSETCGQGMTIDQGDVGPIGVEVIAATRVDVDGVTVFPAPAVTRDDLAKLVETTLRGLSLRIGPNASDLLVAGKWQTLPLTGAECREIAAVVAEGLDECVDIRLRPTEGSDTDADPR